MAPTYASGAVLWTRPVDRPLQRGDVVIADTPEGRVIKRVALLPGDRRLQFFDGSCWQDVTTMGRPATPAGRRLMRTLLVPPGTVFLLGDNVDYSIDSRSFGPISTANVRRFVIDQRSPDSNSGIERASPRAWLAEGRQPEPSRSDVGVRVSLRRYPMNL